MPTRHVPTLSPANAGGDTGASAISETDDNSLSTVVAIGVADGGWPSLGRLFAGIPPRTGFIYLVAATRDTSELVAMLARTTQLPVEVVSSDGTLTCDHIFVLTPGIVISAQGSEVRAIQIDQAPERKPIDTLLGDLARQIPTRCIGVVLSGCGADGGEGLQAMQAAGGTIIVQRPDEAEEDSMPRHAIALCEPDLILPAGEIGALLLRLGRIDSGSSWPAPDAPSLAAGALPGATRASTGAEPHRLDGPLLVNLLQAVPGPGLVLDQRDTIILANDALHDLLGTEQLTGQTLGQLLVPQDGSIGSARGRHQPEGLAQSREDVDEARIRHSDGTYIAVSVRQAALDLEGQHFRIFGLQDLRPLERLQMECEALRAQVASDDEDLRRLHELAMQLSTETDQEVMLDGILQATVSFQSADVGAILLLDTRNQTFATAARFGYPAEDDSVASHAIDEGMGRLASQAPLVIPDLVQEPEIAARCGLPADFICRATHAVPIMARNRQLRGVLITCFRQPHRPGDRDLRIIDLYSRMAANVIERTEAAAALRNAHRRADEANRAKSQLLAAAIHDLRQPLQSIGLLQGVLEQQVMSSQARVTLARIEDATEQMIDLIEGLLDLHQIETGSLQVDMTDLRIAPILQQLGSEYLAHAEAKGLGLRGVSSSAVCKGDRRLLSRMLRNLLSNAIKYTDAGRILIGCRRRGCELRIEVWDTGIGIASDKVHAIFDEFYRVDPSDNGRSGLGLGLHIVKRFAELLSYKIDVRSTPGRGTMVAISVPLIRQGDGLPGTEPLRSPDPVVLLIQNDGSQLSALEALLATNGYQVIAARNIQDARMRAKTAGVGRFDAIVTEANLPDGGSGLTLVRSLRECLHTDIPALVLSGSAPATSAPGDDADGLLFLMKPVKPGALLASLEALVRRTRPEWRRHGTLHRPISDGASLPNPLSNIAVIDDEPSVRSAIRAILEAQAYEVDTFSSAEAYLADPDRGRFQCLVLDISLGGMSGLDLLEQLKNEPRRPPVIFLTGAGGVPLAVRAMREGAADFLHKPVDSAVLRDSIARAMAQDLAHDAGQSDIADIEHRLASLTKREREIMDRIVVGQLNKNIAADLNISERTTEHHRQSIMRKMGVRSLAMLVRMITAIEGRRG